jgi:NTP pyrophosphatase (non-canonical NTP hydrolase)
MPLSFDQYQEACSWTKNTKLSPDLFLATLGLGIVGEGGEIADRIKKVVGHGHAKDRKKMTEELGDLLWYVAMIATQYDIHLYDIAGRNVEKLRERYPRGFSSERSINRQGE